MTSPQAESSHKNSRRSRRPSRRSGDSSNFQKTTTPNFQEQQSRTAIRREDHTMDVEANTSGTLEVLNPLTPTRHKARCEGSASKHTERNGLDPANGQRRGKAPKSKAVRASAPPSADTDCIPASAPPHQSTRPNRLVETPVKAYAGPTFHASPAASSLPLPKFFSKSVPDVDKTCSLKVMMDHETNEITSGSEDSPSLENSHPSYNRQVWEDSPLDIFFRADREAKARGWTGNVASPNNSSSGEVRHHSRHHTDSSLRGIFPLEMDGASTEVRETMPREGPVNPIHQTPSEADQREEHRKAQTLDLKKLLYSPRPQRPASSSPRSISSPHLLGFPVSKTSPRGCAPAQVPESLNRDPQRQAALLALAQKQIPGMATANNVSANQRPAYSKLRKQLSMPTSPGLEPIKPPATQSQPNINETPARTNGQVQILQNGYILPYSPFSSDSSTPSKTTGDISTTSNRHSKDAKSIEDDLRRILKLDVLGGDSTATVGI